MNCTAFGLMSAIPLLLLHARMTTSDGEYCEQPGNGNGKDDQYHFDFQ